MAEWAPKVFWKEVGVAPRDRGYEVTLDGRPVRTPNRRPLILPTRPLADLIAAEWAAQSGEIRPEAMPATRMANSAVEKVAAQRDEIITLIAAYGETDLICYRAESPEPLIARQAEGWDPLLRWAETALNARLHVSQGVMPVLQEAQALARLRDEVAAMDDFRLAAFHDLVALSGSLILGLAVIHGARDAETAWDLSRIDEDWQSAQWGSDDEAEAAASARRRDFLFASGFHERAAQ